jgi:pimeloyl-ACP methyl ester carboxylesterase
MRVGKLPAILGGSVGVLTAVAATAVAQQRRKAARERSRVEVGSAALFTAPEVRDQGRVLTDDGVELYWEEIGGKDAGVTVLFVHGYTLNLGSFHFQRLALTTAFGDSVRQVFYDQRSHGRSARAPSESCTIEQLGHDLYSVIDQLVPTGPIVLVGHSMGGMTVMALADLHPELFRAPAGSGAAARVRSVVLINTSSGDLKNLTLGLPSALARLQAPVLPIVLRRAAKNAALVEQARAMGRDLAWAMTKRLSFAAEDVDPAVVAYATTMISATPVDVVADFYPTLMAHDGRLGLRNLKGCPVLVIGADSDAMTPLEHSKAIARELPEARLIVAEHSGHLLMLEHPELVDEPLVGVVEAVLAGSPELPGAEPVSA